MYIDAKSNTHLFCSFERYKEFLRHSNHNYKLTKSLGLLQINDGYIFPLEKRPGKESEDCMYGGVTDYNFHFVIESLNHRVSPLDSQLTFKQWYTGANPSRLNSKIDYIDQTVIFLGPFHAHLGHFMTESLSRMWPYLQGFSNLPAIYIAEERKLFFSEYTSLFGFGNQQLVWLKEPVQFKTILIPEPSFQIHSYYHYNYTKTINKIKSSVEPKKYGCKVYLSKGNILNGRATGENIFSDQLKCLGFQNIRLSDLSIRELISIMKSCDSFAATSATASHQALFLESNKQSICLNRSAHFHPIQVMIDSMCLLKSTYIDAYLYSAQANFGWLPCFVFPTKYYVEFLIREGLPSQAMPYFFARQDIMNTAMQAKNQYLNWAKTGIILPNETVRLC